MTKRLIILLTLLPALGWADTTLVLPGASNGVFKVGDSITTSGTVYNVYWQELTNAAQWAVAGHYFVVAGNTSNQFCRLPAGYSVTRLGSDGNRGSDDTQHNVMKRWGGTVRRDRIDWKTIEVSDGVYTGFTNAYYAALSHDDVIAYRSNEFTAIWQIYGAGAHAPLHIRSNSVWLVDKAQFLTSYSNFCVQVYGRYGGRGLAWEPFNEPDPTKIPPGTNSAYDVEYTDLVINMHKAARAAMPGEKIYGPAAGTSAVGGEESIYATGIVAVVDAVTWHDGISHKWPYTKVDVTAAAWNTVAGRLAAHTNTYGTTKDFIVDELSMGGLSALGLQHATNGLTLNTDYSEQPWDSAWHDAAKTVVAFRAYGTNIYFHYYGLGWTDDNQFSANDSSYGPHPRASAFMQTLYLLEGAQYVSHEVLGGAATNGWRYTYVHPTLGTNHFAWTTNTNSLPLTALTNGVPDILTAYTRANIWQGSLTDGGVLTHEPSFFYRGGSANLPGTGGTVTNTVTITNVVTTTKTLTNYVTVGVCATNCYTVKRGRLYQVNCP